MKTRLFPLLLILILVACNSEKNVIDLSGKWTVALDSTDMGLQNGFNNELFTTSIMLPGTTDDACLGVPNTLEPALSKPQLLRLTRNNSYLGAAWYSRNITIPQKWEGTDIVLRLERAIWGTSVFIDGVKVQQECESLIAPHEFDLTPYLKAGKKHLLTVRVDNRKRHDISVNNLAHAYTDDTQIIWNGILGEITLSSLGKVRVEDIRVTPNITTKVAGVDITVINNTKNSVSAQIALEASLKNQKKQLSPISETITVQPGVSTFHFDYPMGDDVVLWSEFTPSIYTMNSTLTVGECKDYMNTEFGMRSIGRKGSVLTINDKPLFLRGSLECCIFPLTGTPPMTKEGWGKAFSTAKQWGLNHLRFHSWCPPKAAFEVADSLGFYLQVELPVWTLTVGADTTVTQFMRAEGERMIREYGNHPSFALFSIGNELQFDIATMSALVTEFRANDPRHLYTSTSFTFEKGHGDWPESVDDFFITQWTKKGWVRGQGVFNSESPTFNKDYSAAVDGMTVPLVTHEIGQYAVYPDIREIEKYTGVLTPLNFMAVRDDLVKKKMIDKAPLFTEASGKMAAILYKEEIERAMKTAGISGYQLLNLHDFPGQGTALVGLLDAFWDTKGVIAPEVFAQFCAPVVPLLRFPKAVYTNDEVFEADIEVSNYGADALSGKKLIWSITDKAGKTLMTGKSDPSDLQLGYNASVSKIAVPLATIDKASQLFVKLDIEGTSYTNDWKIWVYPAKQSIDYGKVKIARNLDETMSLLAAGERVLFNPDWKTIKGIEGKFIPVFWSPVHFPRQAGTMGLLCDPQHKALAQFPTDMHTDWQWWDLNINSTTLILDSINGGAPIIEMIDNFTNNRRLASMIEAAVDGGKLVISTIDLSTNLDKRPAAKQLLVSLLAYMNSDDFTPPAMTDMNNLSVFKRMIKSDAKAAKEDATSIY